MNAYPRARRSASLPALGTTLLAALLAGGAIGACGIVDGADDLFASGGVGSGTTGGGQGGGASSSSSSSGTAQGGASSSSSSSGTAQGGGSSSSSSGQGGEVTVPEDCLDGIDNDLNGLVDCADPACNAGFTCVSPTPGGWTGYFWVHEAPFPEAQPAPCPPNTQAGLPLFDGPAGDAQCSACACGDVQGATCAPAPITCFPGSGSCNNNGGNWTDALKDGACHKPSNLLGFNNQLSCQLAGDSAVQEAGTCNPSGGAVQNPAMWAKQVDVCGAVKTGAGCGGGQVCVPRGANGPGESLCVQKEGMKGCPDGWKANTINAFTGGTDTRSCDACTCGGATTTCGATSYAFHDLDQCGDSDPPVVIDSNTCKSISVLLDQFSWSVKASLPQPSGTCEANGGGPKGNVQPDGPVTFCCK